MSPPSSTMIATAPAMLIPSPLEPSLVDPQVLSSSMSTPAPYTPSSPFPLPAQSSSHTPQASGRGVKRSRRKMSCPNEGSSTNSGADNPEPTIKPVDPTTMTMTDLCRDVPVGETSQREKEMQKIDWAAVKRRRIQREQEMIEKHRKKKSSRSAEDENSGSDNEPGDGDDPKLEEGEGSQPKSKPKIKKLLKRPPVQSTTKIVNGKIILINDSGLEQVDRHAEADAEVAQLEEVEEDDITMFFNRSTLVNQNRRDPADRVSQRGSERWSAEQESAFFAGLRMVGTDFGMLSQMIPGKSRRQVKAKFLREERIDPVGISNALLSESVPIHLPSYQQATGLKDEDLIDPEALQRELDQIRAVHDLEMEKDRAEQQRARARMAAAADSLPPPPAKKRSKAKVAAMYGGEEEVVTEFRD